MHFYDDTGQILDPNADSESGVCFASDTYCVATCKCSSTRRGDACEMTEAEYNAKVESRELMAVTFVKLIESEDITPETVSNWIEKATSLGVASGELSNVSAELLLGIVTRVLDSAAVLGDVPVSELLIGLAIPIDSLLAYVARETEAGR